MEIDKQVLYRGRWVDKDHFRVFVYNSTGEKLVKSYNEFSDAISSGIWFGSKEESVQEVMNQVKKDNEPQKVLKLEKKDKSCPNLKSV